MICFLADGHKIDGAHFTTDNGATTKVIVAQAQPYDLPLATLRVQVFNDNASTNGQWDEGDETYDPQLNRAARMPGFTAHLADVMGEVTTDWYGNPLCTTYRATTAPGRTGYELDAQGDPIILTRGGQCVSNMAGEIVVPNMGPDRYAVTVLAPARRSSRPRACSPPAATRTGSRRRPSRAAPTGTPGSRRAPPATTPSSCTPASPPRGRRPASSARATSRTRTRTTSAPSSDAS